MNEHTKCSKYIYSIIIGVITILLSDSGLFIFNISEMEHLFLGLLIGLYGVFGLVMNDYKKGQN